MKNNRATFLLLNLILLITSSYAIDLTTQNRVQTNVDTKITLKTQDLIEVGVQAYWYKYEEEVDGDFFMSTAGKKLGLSLTATKIIDTNIYLIGDFRYAAGDVEYNSDSGTGDISEYMYESRVLMGIEKVIDGIFWSPFLGLGYRYLFNDLRSLGSGGYRRESRYIYIPVGLTHRFKLNQKSRIATTFEYDYFVKGKQKSHLSDIGPDWAAVFGDPVNEQKHGYGIRLHTSYEEKNWSIGVFYNYWKIEDSEKNYYLDPPFLYSIVEPKNETKELGIQLKYRF